MASRPTREGLCSRRTRLACPSCWRRCGNTRPSFLMCTTGSPRHFSRTWFGKAKLWLSTGQNMVQRVYWTRGCLWEQDIVLANCSVTASIVMQCLGTFNRWSYNHNLRHA
ncbi:unnamed protein product [Heterosigma akashiwo]